MTNDPLAALSIGRTVTVRGKDGAVLYAEGAMTTALGGLRVLDQTQVPEAHADAHARTDALLRDAGYANGEIAALRAAKVV